MFVNKMGAQHLDYGKNCQDYGLEKDCLKVVCDGCSEGAHSEVGAKAYCHLAASGYDTEQIFQLLMGIFGQSSETSGSICALRFWRWQSRRTPSV